MFPMQRAPCIDQMRLVLGRCRQMRGIVDPIVIEKDRIDTVSTGDRGMREAQCGMRRLMSVRSSQHE